MSLIQLVPFKLVARSNEDFVWSADFPIPGEIFPLELYKWRMKLRRFRGDPAVYLDFNSEDLSITKDEEDAENETVTLTFTKSVTEIWNLHGLFYADILKIGSQRTEVIADGEIEFLEGITNNG